MHFFFINFIIDKNIIFAFGRYLQLSLFSLRSIHSDVCELTGKELLWSIMLINRFVLFCIQTICMFVCKIRYVYWRLRKSTHGYKLKIEMSKIFYYHNTNWGITELLVTLINAVCSSICSIMVLWNITLTLISATICQKTQVQVKYITILSNESY